MKKIGRRLALKFIDILGADSFLTEPEDTSCYSFDASGLQFVPAAVALPSDSLQVRKMVRLCNEEGIPVIPRGAGSGTTGGSLPSTGGVVVSLTRMNRIRSIDPVELSCVVEPGVVTGILQREVEKRGLFYPPDPASLAFCTIGGNVNTCAGGARAVKYGVTRDYVRALKIVLSDGEEITVGTSTAKGVVGYDLRHLFVGAEGTLGIVTEITLRLLPLPEAVGTVAAVFLSTQQAIDSITGLFESNILPRCAEFLDGLSLSCIADLLPFEPGDEAQAFILIEVDGPTDAVISQLEDVDKSLYDNGALQIYRPKTGNDSARLWTARRKLSPSIKKLGFEKKISEDICVPRARLSSMLTFLDDVQRVYPVTIITFGHAGDGNLHVNLLFNTRDLRSGTEIEEVITQIMKKTVAMGGTISGEHGVGLSKRAFLEIELSPRMVELHKQIKDVFDPKNILNPHKIF